MSYMVIFRTADGKPGYQQADDVQGAAASVERLRNEDGVDNVRIYRMEEVAFEYKVHYSVQLTDPAAPAPAPATDPVDTADTPAWDDDHEDEPAAPFDQMAVDPSGSPQWDDATEEPAVEPVDPPEPVASEGDARRGLFGR